MTPKVFFRKAVSRVRNECELAWLGHKTRYDYYHRPATGAMTPRPEGDFCDLAVVAFNNSEVVDYQIRTLRKFFRYPYRHTVFDNSTSEDKAREIEAVCRRHATGYVRLPRQEFLQANAIRYLGSSSHSHGIACNYLFNNYILNGGGKYFGLLDHDIFPVAPFDISRHLDDQFFYGHRIHGYFGITEPYNPRRYGYFIWPGLWFIRMDYSKIQKVDFRPSLRLHGDTGSRNGVTLFKGLDWSQYKLAEERHCLFDGAGDIFDGGYSLFDNAWVHCWNASNYMGKPNLDRKMRLIYQMLEERLA